MRGRALTRLIIGSLALLPTAVFARREQDSDYLPGALYQLERAKTNMASGQDAVAMANTHLALHDQGLRVYVDLSDTPDSLQASCQNAAKRSIQYWNDTLGAGSLVEVDTPSASQVQISFHKEVFLKGAVVGGYCTQSRAVETSHDGAATPNYEAKIQARFTLNGKTLNEDCLTNIVTHEIGHVYGLNDSSDRSRLMGGLMTTRPKFELHPDELEALKQLRLRLFEIQRSIVAKSKGN